MTGHFTMALTFLAAIGSGLMGGFFFAFSTTVMTALARLAPAPGIAAMQSINATVLNPVFFVAFFGTGAVAVLCAAMAFASGESGAWIILAAAAIYLVGCIGVTMAYNVPLNKALAAAAPDTPEAAALWSRYLKTWTAWNHIRTLACIAAAAAFIAGLMR